MKKILIIVCFFIHNSLLSSSPALMGAISALEYLENKTELDFKNKNFEPISFILMHGPKLRVLAINNPGLLKKIPNLNMYLIPVNDKTPEGLPHTDNKIYLTLPQPHENFTNPLNIRPFSIAISGCPFDPITGKVVAHKVTIKNETGEEAIVETPCFFYSDLSQWYRSNVDQNGKLVWIKI